MKLAVNQPVYPFKGYENLSETEKRNLIFNNLLENKKYEQAQKQQDNRS